MQLGLGIAKGASFVNDWDKDIDRTYQRAEYAAKIQAEKEQKTAYYANLLKKGHGTNPRAESELNDFYKGLNGKLADFVTENPNFETDIDAMQKFLDIQDQYLNNDILRTDLQTKQEFDKLRNAVASGNLTQEEYLAETKRYDDYINKRTDEPYVFTNFQQIDLDKIAFETTKSVGEVELPGTKKKDVNTGEWSIDIGTDPTKLRSAAESTYADPKTNAAIQKRFADIMKSNPALADTYKGSDASLRWWNDYLKVYSEFKKFNSGMDLKDRRIANGDSDVGAEYALSGKIKSLMDLAQYKDDKGNFIDGSRTQSSEYDIFLTGWGNQTTTILSNSLGVKVFVDGQYKDFSLMGNITAEQLSNGDWVSIGGVPYLEINTSIQNPLDDATVVSNDNTKGHEGLKSLLRGYGFQQQETLVGGLGPSSVGAAKEVNGLKHTGKIYIPLQASPESLTNWTRTSIGLKEANKYAPLYNAKQNELRELSISNRHNIKLETEVSKDDLPSAFPYQPGRYKWGVSYKKGSSAYGKRGVVDLATGDFTEMDG